VKNVFLDNDLHEKFDMEQPPGFVTHEKSFGLVCRLCKSLYDFTQSLRAWFGKLALLLDNLV